MSCDCHTGGQLVGSGWKDRAVMAIMAPVDGLHVLWH